MNDDSYTFDDGPATEDFEPAAIPPVPVPMSFFLVDCSHPSFAPLEVEALNEGHAIAVYREATGCPETCAARYGVQRLPMILESIEGREIVYATGERVTLPEGVEVLGREGCWLLRGQTGAGFKAFRGMQQQFLTKLIESIQTPWSYTDGGDPSGEPGDGP